MKILAICPRIPEDGKKGDQVLSFHRLSYLARNHKIELICFASFRNDSQAIHKLESLGIFVRFIRWNNIRAVLGLLGAVFDKSIPLQCALFNSAGFQQAIQSSLINFKPDFIYAVTIRGLVNLDSYNTPLFVDLVDSMALNFSRRVKMAHGLKRWVLNFECGRVAAYERQVAERSNRSFVVSSIDQRVIGSDKVDVIPLGIDGRQFFINAVAPVDPVIVFSGNMNWCCAI